ncbi:MAG: AAA family ATPase [Chloroflexi bacterium]|nr:AAA family ATPase [Chloroflexota bacterium]
MRERRQGLIEDRGVLPVAVRPPQSVFDVLVEFDAELKQGDRRYYEPYPTGFTELDEHLGGGIKPGELVLLGGAQGIGKTIAALQWARNLAAQSQVTALYVCFEHDERYLFHRLLCLESAGDPAQPGLTLRDIRQAVLHPPAGSPADLRALLHALPAARWAFDALTGYWEHLFLVKGNPLYTTWEVLHTYLRNVIAEQGRERVALFVDYLQKVPMSLHGPRVLDEESRITVVAEALKNLALAFEVPVVAVVAADKEGLQAGRIRLHHLRGEAALAYECDVAVMLNSHAVCMGGNDLDLVVFTVEKNRTGPADVNVVYRRRGAQFRFETAVEVPGGRPPC